MYRTIDARFWSDPKVKGLTPPAKLLLLYAITNSHSHVSGIYYLPSSFAAHEIGLRRQDVDTLLDALSGAGLIQFDKAHDLIWVVNMMKYQARGEKNQRAAAAQLANLHNSFLIPHFLAVYPNVRKYLTDRVYDPSPAQDRLRTPDQDQDQDQEQDKSPLPPEGENAKPDEPKPDEPKPAPDPFPEALRTAEFRAAWETWLSHRREIRKPATPRAIEMQLKSLAAFGPEQAVRLIERAVRSGWTGVNEDIPFEGRGARPGPAKSRDELIDDIFRQKRAKEAGDGH